MKFIIQMPGAESEPLNESEIAVLYTAGALHDQYLTKKITEETWSPLIEACPFLRNVYTTNEITERLLAPTSKEKNQTAHIILKGMSIPFWDLVGLLVKTAIAAIPAILILLLIYLAVALTFGVLGSILMSLALK